MRSFLKENKILYNSMISRYPLRIALSMGELKKFKNVYIEGTFTTDELENLTQHFLATQRIFTNLGGE